MKPEKPWDMRGIILVKTETGCKEQQNFNQVSCDFLQRGR